MDSTSDDGTTTDVVVVEVVGAVVGAKELAHTDADVTVCVVAGPCRV